MLVTSLQVLEGEPLRADVRARGGRSLALINQSTLSTFGLGLAGHATNRSRSLGGSCLGARRVGCCIGIKRKNIDTYKERKIKKNRYIERETDRKRQRQRYRETERERERERDRYIERQSERDRDRDIERQRERKRERETDI